ncbi:MAG: serine/threonine-protein phosphatase [Planctomycetes bacterium]|nr:serine/threonine-protein phosphatase [Planctomycetota bacterium]
MPILQDTRRMRCMEVWGGNTRSIAQLETTGLDVWITSQPEGGSHTGGDVYYVSSCASGRITRVLLADVSGHGELVSASAVRLRDLMRRNVNRINHRRFVSAMNGQFAEAGGGRFATAIVSSFFAPTRSLALCNAGHPPPLIFRVADSTWSKLDPSHVAFRESGTRLADLPFGVVADTVYNEYSTRLETGDLILSYTDAFSEAEAADGTMLGVEGFFSVVCSIPTSPITEFLPRLTQSLQTLHADNLSRDDATMLLLRANGKRSSARDNVLAPFRLLGKVADASHIAQPSPAPRSHAASDVTTTP